MIDVTHLDIRKMVKAAYDLSSPQGLGFLHATPDSLTDEEIDQILSRGTENSPVDMDYIKGRSCKFHISKDDEGRLSIYDSWYDHSDSQLEELLSRSKKGN